ACAAALAVQRVIVRDNLLANVLARGEQLRARLREVFADHPNVGDVRGRGLFVGVEFVRDRADKSVLDPALKTHARLKRQAMENGLMVYPMGGTVDGVHGDHVLLAPPFICSAADIDEIAARLDRTVRQILPV
ncbi:MAG: aminotransferase class III-fold pyridoxal phosphate-dependent enzyme, partial [Castellaniella sp.]